MRLAPREKILLAAVDIEIHNAIDDVRAEARNMGVQTLDLVSYIDVEANIDVYDYPEEAEEIRDIFTLRAGTTPLPLNPVGFREQPLTDYAYRSGDYTLLPGRKFRVMNCPTSSSENGFMVRYFPAPKRLVKPTDEPNLPRPVHENVIPQAVVRLASYDGIRLVHPSSFEKYRALMVDRLGKFLQPATADATNYVRDVDSNYTGGSNDHRWQ